MIAKIKAYFKNNTKILIYLILAFTIIFFIPILLYFLEKYLKLVVTNENASKWITDFFNIIKDIMGALKDLILASAPFITLYLNKFIQEEHNKQAKDLKQIEFENNFLKEQLPHKLKAYEEYAGNLEAYVDNFTPEKLLILKKSYYHFLVYCDKNESEILTNLQTIIQNKTKKEDINTKTYKNDLETLASSCIKLKSTKN